MTQRFVNNYATTVAATLGAGDTFLQVDSAAALPLLATGEYLLLTLFRKTGVQESGHEVVRVTEIVENQLTVTRSVEGAAASMFLAGDHVEARMTAGSAENMAQKADLSVKADSNHAHSLASTETPGFMSPEQVSKLSGISAGATPNSTDSVLLSRSNHTGEQAIATITGLQTALDGALPKVGGSLSGPLSGAVVSAANFLDKTVTNATATGTVALNFAQGDVFDLTLTGITTLALANLPSLSDETLGFVVRVTQGAAAYALTWFPGITWLTTNGVAPAAPASNKVVEYVFTTRNGTAFLGRKGAAT